MANFYPLGSRDGRVSVGRCHKPKGSTSLGPHLYTNQYFGLHANNAAATLTEQHISTTSSSPSDHNSPLHQQALRPISSTRRWYPVPETWTGERRVFNRHSTSTTCNERNKKCVRMLSGRLSGVYASLEGSSSGLARTTLIFLRVGRDPTYEVATVIRYVCVYLSIWW